MLFLLPQVKDLRIRSRAHWPFVLRDAKSFSKQAAYCYNTQVTDHKSDGRPYIFGRQHACVEQKPQKSFRGTKLLMAGGVSST
jgi:hypothetical protein